MGRKKGGTNKPKEMNLPKQEDWTPGQWAEMKAKVAEQDAQGNNR